MGYQIYALEHISSKQRPKEKGFFIGRQNSYTHIAQLALTSTIIISWRVRSWVRGPQGAFETYQYIINLKIKKKKKKKHPHTPT